jgi:hypothetical protein
MEFKDPDVDFSDACRKIYKKFEELTSNINIYDVYGICWPTAPSAEEAFNL